MEDVSLVLADADVDRRIDLKKMLFQNPDMEVVGETEDAESTLSTVTEETPDLLLLSYPLDSDEMGDLVEDIAVESPQTEIILLAESMEDSEDARKLQRRGARDTLVRPIESEELMDNLKEIVSLARRKQEKLSEMMGGQTATRDQRTGKIISVFSTKGGVGRSLLSTNLACMIKKVTDKSVALVDLDLQFGDAAIMLDMTPTTMIASLARDCKEEDRVDYDLLERYMHTHEPSGIDLLAAPPRPEEADYVQDADTRKILQALKQHYHYVVIDTSSQVTEPAIAALENSDLILLLLTLELPTIKDGKLMLELIDNLGLTSDKVQIIMNRDEPGSEIELQEIEEALEQEVLGGLPSQGDYVMPSVNEGTPVVLSHPQCKFSVELEEVTRHIIEDYFELGEELVEADSTQTGPGTVDLNLAPLGNRFLAGFIDYLISFVAGFGIFAGAGSFAGTLVPGMAGTLVIVLMNLIGLAVPICYYGFLESDIQTLGKQFNGLKTVNLQEETISTGSAFVRGTVMVLVNFLFLGLPLLWIIIDNNNQGLHDLAAGTYVIEEITSAEE